MKKFILILSVIVLFFPFLLAAGDIDKVPGYWISYDEKTQKATGAWYLYIKGDKLFGEMVAVAGYPQDVLASSTKGKKTPEDFPKTGKLNEMTLLGTPWIFNMEKNIKKDRWDGGNIIDPNDGNCYKCVITFRNADNKKYKVDTLEMRGEIGLGIGRSQFWQKATESEARAVR